ncbi:Tn3 family transposase [Actinoplanes sp. NEAU-A12]|uniref:Tn3 family transposase n=1 Tax=Actinoplanes sandaracinus TaxID=3045177 RepID=A0ABT6WVX6_9ACTN|nr:Tn3 family transposase [Actinoplanes sandaracinus]
MSPSVNATSPVFAPAGLQPRTSASGTTAYADEGALRCRHHEQQTEQMWCLTLATNAIVCWSTEYHGLGVAALRRTGRDVDDELLAHIWPTHHENVHFYGTHSVDIDGELARLDTDGYRPLRLNEPAPTSILIVTCTRISL